MHGEHLFPFTPDSNVHFSLSPSSLQYLSPHFSLILFTSRLIEGFWIILCSLLSHYLVPCRLPGLDSVEHLDLGILFRNVLNDIEVLSTFPGKLSL